MLRVSDNSYCCCKYVSLICSANGKQKTIYFVISSSKNSKKNIKNIRCDKNVICLEIFNFNVTIFIVYVIDNYVLLKFNLKFLYAAYKNHCTNFLKNC